MTDLQARLGSAFEDAGHEVDAVTRNRDTIRVVLPTGGVEATALRAVVADTLAEEELMALNVTTESTDGQGMQTVVSFRYRG
jgi:hypothetical protein